MKCVKKEGVIQRVKDDRAAEMIKTEGYSYCPKSEWKESKGAPKEEKPLEVLAE